MKFPKPLKYYVRDWLSSRDEYRAVTRRDVTPSDLELVRRGGDLCTRHYDVPGIPRGRYDAPKNAAPCVWTEQDLTGFLIASVQESAARGSWVDKPFYLGVYLADELHHCTVWRELERGFEYNNKRPAIERILTDFWVINGQPYWYVRIVATCVRAYENGPMSLPMISFS
jgi:hypothetical protein